MEIYVDSRREKDFLPFLRKSFPGIIFLVKTLNEGDYESPHVLVERKTMADLYQSVVGNGTQPGRLQDQLGRLSIHDDKVVLFLITGSVGRFFKKMTDEIGVNVNVEVIYGTIASISARERIHVLWIEDEWDGLYSMVKFILKVEEGKYMVPSKREPDQLCAKLLGVNMVQWKDLKRRFGSLPSIAMAKEQDLQKVYGIGAVKAKKIKEILNKAV